MWSRMLVALIISSVGVKTSEEIQSRIVNIEQGPVKGYKDEKYGLYAFIGIPYASAPTGTDRFKAPLPPPTWMNTLEAVDRGVICPQSKSLLDQMPYPPGIIVTEDCLVASVYVPDTEEQNLPVLVSVHGGGFFFGFGDWFTYKQFIKENNVIVVNFNYRLGAHGFLCLGTKDVPGNAGMKDQVALLRWVKKNIRHFGGNPDYITIQGGSAGSASVDLMMLSKSAEGLFNKVIPESGASIAVFSIQSDPLANAKKFARILNFTNVDNLSALEKFYKTVSFDLLLLDPFLFFNVPDSSLLFSPCVERPTGEEMFLDKSPVDILKSGDYTKVPLLYGFSEMEGLVQIKMFDQWKERMNEKFSDFMPADLKFDSEQQKAQVAQSVKEFYFGEKPVSERNVLAFVDYFTDVMFAYSSLRTVKYHLEAGHDQVYLYQYTFVDENTPYVLHTDVRGATHCAQSFAVMYENAFFPNIKSAEFEKTSKIVRKIWSNFVKTGKPVPEGSSLPAWPPVNRPWAPHMDIGKELQLKGSLLEERILFWDQIYSRHYRDPVPAGANHILRNEL